MKITILILWLHAGGWADTRGSIAMQEFNSPETCAFALQAAKKGAKYLSGVCVPK